MEHILANRCVTNRSRGSELPTSGLTVGRCTIFATRVGYGNEITRLCKWVFFFQLPQEAGNIRCIVPQIIGGIDGKLYFGTTNSAILEGSLQLKFRYIVQVTNDH